MPDDDVSATPYPRREPYSSRIADERPSTRYDGMGADDLFEQLIVTDGPGGRGLVLQIGEESDADAATKALLIDLVISLAPAFMPADARSPYPDNLAIAGGQEIGPLRYRTLDPAVDRVVAVKYNTVNVGSYHALAPTNRQVTFDAIVVHGVDEDGRPSASRYVDWNFVMAQLGVVGTQRPMLGFDGPGLGVVTPRPGAELAPPKDGIALRETDEPDPRRGRRRRLLAFLRRL